MGPLSLLVESGAERRLVPVAGVVGRRVFYLRVESFTSTRTVVHDARNLRLEKSSYLA